MSGPASDPAARPLRVLALQPRMTVDNLAEPVMSTHDPAVLEAMTNLVRVWAWKNKSVPADFAEKAVVTAVSRQPVCFVAIDLERCQRSTRQVTSPLFPGRQVNAAPWTTMDLFTLMPLTKPAFATTAATTQTPVPGREEASTCERCDGAGANACRNCSGGKIACPGCFGALRITCSRCGGSGTHLGVSGRMIQCRNCNTRGTVACDRCAKQGTINCPVCHGEGTLSCDPCGGQGNVLRSWELVENRRTDHRHRALLAERWPGDWEAAVDRSDVVDEQIYTADGQRPDFDVEAPPGPRQQAADLLREALNAHAAELRSGRAADRVVATRVRLRGLYAYDVRLDYRGKPYALVVAGGAVTPRKLPRPRRGPVSFFIRLLKRYLQALQSDEVAGPRQAFIDAVRGGRCHITDDACLLPDVAARLGTPAEVTADGYRCYVRDHTPGEMPLTVGLDVRFDLDDADRKMLCVDFDLGEAHRDRFVRMLAACHDLPVGRLAVVDGDAGTERLVLVDRRPYATCDAGQYAGALRMLASASRRLRGPVD